MRIPTEGKLLRIFVGEADRWHGRPLYQAIVEEARTRGHAAYVVSGLGRTGLTGAVRYTPTHAPLA
jgi:PII-like signaling protein